MTWSPYGLFYLFFVSFVKCKFKAGLLFQAELIIMAGIGKIFVGSEGRIQLLCSLLWMADNPGPEKLKDSLPASELSFDELYEHYATDVLRVAYYYLGDRQRAEDVMQDVFVKYLLNRPALQPGRE